MQMNYKIAGQFEHLYPITLGDNVKLNSGKTLEEWKQEIDDLSNLMQDSITEVWSGSEVMEAEKTITIPKSLSDCKNGWILVFKYASSNANYSYHYVPKIHTSIASANASTKFVTSQSQTLLVKSLYFTDTTIRGFSTNNSGGNEAIVLIKVFSH